jgi:hypothetical protein
MNNCEFKKINNYIDPCNTKIEKNISSEYPGPYFNFLLKELIGKKIYLWTDESDGKVVMVFSKVLLRQQNYHITGEDEFGLISEKTYSKKSLSNNISEGSEIVFHDSVSTKALQAIWVFDKKIFDELKKFYKGKPKIASLIVLISDEKYPNEMYDDHCNEPFKKLVDQGIIVPYKPNFCHMSGYYRPFYKKLLQDCDLPEEVINDYKNNTVKIRERMVSKYLQNPKERSSPVYWPGEVIKPDKPDKPDKKPDKPDKQPEKPDKKPDKQPDKPEKPDKKPDKSEKPDKPDKQKSPIQNFELNKKSQTPKKPTTIMGKIRAFLTRRKR